MDIIRTLGKALIGINPDYDDIDSDYDLGEIDGVDDISELEDLPNDNESCSDTYSDFVEDSNINCLAFHGNTPSFDTGQSVHVVSENGNDKGYFDVFLKEGKKYIKIGIGSSSNWSNWVLIQGKQRFFWNGNWYIIK